MKAGPNPSGLCMCGCGAKVSLAPKTSKRNGWVQGQPVKYLVGHQRRRSPVDYIVDEVTGCWVWQHRRNNRGYGVTARAGRSVYAHRAYYEAVKGPIPAGMQLDHLCRNPACVNPEHLEAVWPIENQRRGRAAKLTVVGAAHIRRMLAAGVSHHLLAEEYGVDESTIRRIRDGRGWKDVAA